jgi:hypothetical protein
MDRQHKCRAEEYAWDAHRAALHGTLLLQFHHPHSLQASLTHPILFSSPVLATLCDDLAYYLFACVFFLQIIQINSDVIPTGVNLGRRCKWR